MIAEEPEKSKGQETEQDRKRKREGAAMYTVKEIEYVYTLVKEDFCTGEQAKRRRKYYSFTPCLKVGGLYFGFGKGYPGCYRVLDMKEELVCTNYAGKPEKNKRCAIGVDTGMR